MTQTQHTTDPKAQRDELLAALRSLRDWCDANINGAPTEYAKLMADADMAIKRAEAC